MKLAVFVGTAHQEWATLGSLSRECERIGVDSIWAEEFAGHDAFAPLAVIASQTKRIRLGTGVIPIGTRSPTLLAMSAATLASVSRGRFILGLGANSRELMEGEHGVKFRPASRHLREVAHIVRLAASGAPIVHDGEFYTIPLGGNPAISLEPGVVARFPIYFASLSVKSLEVTGEVADGWVGASHSYRNLPKPS